MAEGFELPEGHHEHGDNPFLVSVSVTISVLAVLVAAVTLLGHRAHTEELLLQAQATDQWAYYQAKNIRLHEMQSVADMLGALAPEVVGRRAGAEVAASAAALFAHFGEQARTHPAPQRRGQHSYGEAGRVVA